jgi:ATP-binding cassette subfamily B protein
LSRTGLAEYLHFGDLITRINRSSITLHRFSENQFIYIQTIVKFATSIGFLIWISLPVGLLSLFSSLTIMAIVILFDRRLILLYVSENDVENNLDSAFFDYISNIATILTLRLGELTYRNLLQRMKVIWPFFQKEVVLNETKWFSMMVLFSIFQTITDWIYSPYPKYNRWDYVRFFCNDFPLSMGSEFYF